MLWLKKNLFESLHGLARRAYPEECCGLLIGPRGRPNAVVRNILPAQNIAADPQRAYQVDWQTLFEANRALRQSDDGLLGVYHSHPLGSCRPSRRDLRDAWPELIYLILGQEDGRPMARGWRLTGESEAFEEIALHVASEAVQIR